ncbi:MAG: selenocysteine-specific translation elongation factor [Planctomycetota bacterium]|jgi:selenocysteine-specific elongation factor
MSNQEKIAHITIGTAGHIDHGKTALIKALTGTDADRLPEEKKRGITIDIGYAQVHSALGATVGIVDVPGHERFIKNMVAGATGMDAVILVVAADDGVMPQTREHLDILTLLGIRRGLIALTKIDLVDKDMVDLAEEEVRELVRGTFLEDVPLVRTSSATGEGIEDFKKTLQEVIEGTPEKNPSGPFRMPVQRSFSSEGFGTVVTGVPLSGRVRIGDSIELLPKGLDGRIRGIQSFLKKIETGSAGHRTALNVASVDYKMVERGDVVCTPGVFRPVTIVEGRLQLLKSANPILTNTAVRFHVGCAEALGTLILLEGKKLIPGQDMLAQIRLESPVVVAAEDRFVIRIQSPAITIGGGLLFGPSQFRLRTGKDYQIANLKRKETALGNPAAILESRIYERGFRLVGRDEIPFLAEHPKEAAMTLIESLLTEGKVQSISPGAAFIHIETAKRAQEMLLKWTADYFLKHPDKPSLPMVEASEALHFSESLAKHVAESLVYEKRIIRRGGRILLPGREAKLPAERAEIAEKIVGIFLSARFKPPIANELAKKLNARPEIVNETLSFLIETGKLMDLGRGCLLHSDMLSESETMLQDLLAGGKAMTMSEMREAFDSTRKFMIPLMEYFDRKKLTVRDGDYRKLAVT